jgi:predicted dehydrogenase
MAAKLTPPAPIRLGMVGGGEGAFIGAVHRWASQLDRRYELIAGALSATPTKAHRSGRALGLDPDRIYDDYAVMAKAEAARTDGIEAVAIVTPNHLHAPVAEAFMAQGIHVICDKPLTSTLADAKRLAKAAARKGVVFAVTHNYSAYPMVRQARQLVREGQLGPVRVVQVEYAQDWMAEPIEQGGQKQAAWRTDPLQSGGGAIGDIGSHAWQLADFVLGEPVAEVAAQLSSFVKGRAVDDDVQLMLRWASGARGMLWASQVAVGHLNDLKIRIYGAKGGLEWSQRNPDQLLVTALGEPTRIVNRGTSAMNVDAARLSRIPSGHPEGYLEAFANLYGEVAEALVAARQRKPAPKGVVFPTVGDGVRGIQFIDAVQRSSLAGGRWTKVAT